MRSIAGIWPIGPKGTPAPTATAVAVALLHGGGNCPNPASDAQGSASPASGAPTSSHTGTGTTAPSMAPMSPTAPNTPRAPRLPPSPPLSTPAPSAAFLLRLDAPQDRQRLQELLETCHLVFEDSRRDAASLRRAGLSVPETYDDLRLMVHAVDESRSWFKLKTQEWQNGVRPLAEELLGARKLLPPKFIRKLGNDGHQREEQVRLHAHYLLVLYLEFRRRLENDFYSERLYRCADLPLVPIIQEMEARGAACDLPVALKLSGKLRAKQHRLFEMLEGKGLISARGEVLDDEKLRHLLYEKYKQPVTFRTDKGLPSVKRAALLAFGFPNVDAMAEARRIGDLLQHLRYLTTDRIHGEWHIAGAVSGRLYMRSPNLVGFPKVLRHLIIASPGHRLIIVDYCQMELHVLAGLSGDGRLIRLVRAGVDLHTATGAEIYNIPLAKVTEAQRKAGKATNFAIVYGQESQGLSETLGISEQRAMTLLFEHRKKFPRIWDWKKGKIEEARQKGGLLRTWKVGRRRCLPSVCGGKWSKSAERKLINHQVQSLAADIAKMRLIEIAKAVKGDAHPVLFAHDEYVIECREATAESVMRRVVEIAERQVEGFPVPLRVKAVVGESWAEKA